MPSGHVKKDIILHCSMYRILGGASFKNKCKTAYHPISDPTTALPEDTKELVSAPAASSAAPSQQCMSD